MITAGHCFGGTGIIEDDLTRRSETQGRVRRRGNFGFVGEERVAGERSLDLDLRAYRLTAIKKTGYRLAERCTLVIGEIAGDVAHVTLRFRANTSEASALETERAFFQELLDQELREEVGEETAPIRTLIIAHAFSRTNLIRE